MSLKNRSGLWYYRFRANGQEILRSTGLVANKRNQSAALQMEVQARLELATGQTTTAKLKPQAFLVAAAQFLEWCEATEYRGKVQTAQRIATSFASLVQHFGARPVCLIDGPEVEDFKVWRAAKHGVRDITIRHDLHALSVFYRKWAIPRHLAAANPVKTVSIPSDRHAQREHILTEAEEESYFKVAARFPMLYDVAKLLILTGARPEEIYSLPQAAVDLKAKTIRIQGGKTPAATRTLTLIDEAWWIMKRRLATPGTWIFQSDRRPGQHITKLNKQHDDACRLAAVSFCLYDLRHTFATRMVVDAGVDMATVAALLGHSSLRTVSRYVHPQAQAQKDAMAKFEAARKRAKAGIKRDQVKGKKSA